MDGRQTYTNSVNFSHPNIFSLAGAGSIPEAPEDSPLRSVTERKESAIDMAQFFEKVFGRLKSKDATLPAMTGPCNRLAVHFVPIPCEFYHLSLFYVRK